MSSYQKAKTIIWSTQELDKNSRERDQRRGKKPHKEKHKEKHKKKKKKRYQSDSDSSESDPSDIECLS